MMLSSLLRHTFGLFALRLNQIEIVGYRGRPNFSLRITEMGISLGKRILMYGFMSKHDCVRFVKQDSKIHKICTIHD
jgi:hypothetical protein